MKIAKNVHIGVEIADSLNVPDMITKNDDDAYNEKFISKILFDCRILREEWENVLQRIVSILASCVCCS